MGYEIHLEREAPISEAEWRSAVEAVAGVRLASSQEIRAVNPATGEEIVMAGGGADAELQVEGAWVPAFRFRPQRVSFGARNFDEGTPLWIAAGALAAELNAQVVGDEGETYDAKP